MEPLKSKIDEARGDAHRAIERYALGLRVEAVAAERKRCAEIILRHYIVGHTVVAPMLDSILTEIEDGE